jgi:hypothetical protein
MPPSPSKGEGFLLTHFFIHAFMDSNPEQRSVSADRNTKEYAMNTILDWIRVALQFAGQHWIIATMIFLFCFITTLTRALWISEERGVEDFLDFACGTHSSQRASALFFKATIWPWTAISDACDWILGGYQPKTTNWQRLLFAALCASLHVCYVLTMFVFSPIAVLFISIDLTLPPKPFELRAAKDTTDMT